MASVTNSSTGSGYPYPNTLTLNVSIAAKDNNRHTISWSVVATGGASGNWQQVFNGLAGWRVSGGSGWNFIWGSGASVQAWAGATLASSSFDYWHTDYVKLKFIIGGGYYSSANYSENTMYVDLPELYTAPAAPTAENLASDGTPHKAYSKVTNNGWGTNSSRRNFEIINAGRIVASDYDHSPASMYWTLDAGSNDTNACYVHTWYGRAVNNHVLWTDSAARYIATPSAPILTFTPGSGTSPSTTVTANLKYKGGTQKSSTCDNGTMRRWQFAKMLQSATGIPSTFQNDVDNSNVKTQSYTWARSNFDLGNNYKFYVRTVNTLGGASSTTSQVIYCPNGISGTMTANTTETISLKASYNYAGDVNSSTTGTISCYQIKWSTDKATVDGGGGTATSLQTGNTFTITGLTNDQTIYYRVYAWNVYGLSNVSSTLTAKTLPRYNPEISTISTTPLSPGGNVKFTVKQTGGLSANELTVTSATLYRKAGTDSSWTTLKTVTGLSLHANDSYTFTNAWTDIAPREGDYSYRIFLSNGTDSSTTNFMIAAPTRISMSAGLVSPEPIQITAKGVTTTTNQLYRWDLLSVATGQSKTVYTSNTTQTITTSNHLEYNTDYILRMKAYNTYGLWRNSNDVTQRTASRFQFYTVNNGTAQKSDGIFKNKQKEFHIKEVYYVVKNALGNIHIGDDLQNKRLTFITQALRYRPENVASISLSDGTKIAYAYDSTDDVYKFGIWQGNTLQTAFHDGHRWVETEYDFDDSIIVTALSTNSLNMSAPFSTTTCADIPLWEREAIDGYARITYYTDNTHTTTSKIEASTQANITAMAPSSTTGSWSVTISGTTITNSNIKNIVLTDKVSSIPTRFLANSPNLQSAVMYDANVTSIGTYVCYSCSNLINVSLPYKLTSIPTNTLNNCSQLNKNMVLPPNITTIGNYFMANCTRQNQAIEFPSGLTSIGTYFLSGCSSFDQPISFPNTVTSIGNYFLNGCSSFSRDVTLPTSLTSLGSGFLRNCHNMIGTVDVGSLAATIASSSTETLSTTASTAACYVTGIQIKGSTVSNWLSRFANRSSSPYRYLKEWVEPILQDREWNFTNATLVGDTIPKNVGDFGYLPYSDVTTLQQTSNFMNLLDTQTDSSYRTLYENIDNYETADDILSSAEFSGKFYTINTSGKIYNGAGTDNTDMSSFKMEIVKNPTMGIVWTGRGSTSIAGGWSEFWQGAFDLSSDTNYSSITTVSESTAQYPNQIGTSSATITITTDELKNISSSALSTYYIATLTYWNGQYAIYFSRIDPNSYNSSTGSATFYAGATVGPLMLFHKANTTTNLLWAGATNTVQNVYQGITTQLRAHIMCYDDGYATATLLLTLPSASRFTSYTSIMFQFGGRYTTFSLPYNLQGPILDLALTTVKFPYNPSGGSYGGSTSYDTSSGLGPLFTFSGSITIPRLGS